jgi:hypothetical protein
VAHLQAVTKAHTDHLIASKISDASVIDAEDIAHLTVAVFLDFLFGIRPQALDPAPGVRSLEQNQRALELCALIVEASWEWRKEISVRGKANEAVKRRTVSEVLRILEEPERYVTAAEDLARIRKISEVFGERWKEPIYYSLILQPFLISPCINTGQDPPSLLSLHLSLSLCLCLSLSLSVSPSPSPSLSPSLDLSLSLSLPLSLSLSVS